MKIGKKLLMIGLSALMMVTPCFAASKIVAINGKQVILDLYEKDGHYYVSAYDFSDVLSKHGYSRSNHNDNAITITKNNKTLTLSEARGELIKKDSTLYIPLAKVFNYFGDVLEVPKVSNIKETFLNQMDAMDAIIEEFYTGSFLYSSPATKINFKMWENIVDIFYEILLKELPEEEKVKLEQEQENWKVLRENKAKEAMHSQCDHSVGECYASHNFAYDDYCVVYNNITKERAHELLIRLK